MDIFKLKVNNFNVFFIILVCFISAVLLTPIVKKIAYHINAVDKPDNKRKVHHTIMPRLGGLAIFLAFLIGYMIFAPKTTQMLSVLIGGFIIILVGMCDDIHTLKPIYKLIGQIVAACIVVFYGNITLNDMIVFGIHFKFGIFAYPLAVFFVVAIINAINFADGLDGLAAGTSTIYFITIAIIGYIMNRLGGLDVILCLIMAGSCLGFLVYNFEPASIFMGDIGSMFLGFIISIIALLGFKTATITSLIIPLLLLFEPILDTILAMLRRLMNGKSMSSADREHLHHQLLKGTKSIRKSVLIMYGINILFASVSIFYTLGDKKFSMILYLSLLILFIILVLKTDILFDHKNNK
ncbi:MAG: undecaprenyl/decaprenyl-phosphate alpha-N-acetylglucosaminyl 1-phosphate transferase [Erysipelotrichales bacterium]|nr:undecaprenyl/decaprenyl-phosphate alpha-N-acetylglucosaminyl 1-phosphate transferase [Erysipelotrichales bacterium]